MTLSDTANWAQVLSLPLAVVLWLLTRETATRFWKRWQKRIFVLTTVVVLVGLWRFGWLGWLSQPVTLPLWALLLMGGMIVTLGMGYFFIKPMPMPQAPNNWLNYVNDEIFGVRWAWQFVGEKIGTEFSAFCPRDGCRCRLQEKMNLEGDFHHGLPISLVCPNCSFKMNFDCDWKELTRRVSVEIERRINTREYLRRGHPN